MAEPPSPPYIPANLIDGPQDRIDRIVIHGTVNPGTYHGAAEDLGAYFRDLQAPPEGRWASCHYGVDPGAVYQYVYDHTIAYHAPPNAGSIGVELCDPQTGPDSRWDDAEHRLMLGRAADLVRQLCRAYDIPMVWLMPDELAAGARGITDHENVGAAWGQTTHTDPGWSTARSEQFMRRVSGDTHTSTEEDTDMQTDERQALFDIRAQLCGSRTPGEYPGWPSFVDGGGSLTAVDYLRWIDKHTVAPGVDADTVRAVVREEITGELGSAAQVQADAIVDRIAARLGGQEPTQ